MLLEPMKDIDVNLNSHILEPYSKELNFQLCAGEAALNVGSCCVFNAVKNSIKINASYFLRVNMAFRCWEQVNRAHDSACPSC
mmetsp:Transcript_9735/g.14644  ORF Transcript_9735/g.14644 Transcript_9735/m.14644 type:complete len:83 (-) Transcript_9735:294-542(-)